MRFLLDSHILLWAIYAPLKLTERVRELLSDEANELMVSHATLWELLSKIGRGKLLLAGTSVEAAMARIRSLGVTLLPVDEALIIAASSLRHHHSDPFDRMLIAQAIAEDLTVLSADGKFMLHEVRVLWQ